MRIVFIGTGEIGVPTLRTLFQSEHEVVGVVTQPDKPVGRSQRIQSPPVKQAWSGGFPAAEPTKSAPPLLQPTKIKDASAIDQIRQLNPDLIVVMAYGQILPREVLDIAKIACLNLHASLLPRWRGAAPIQAAIASGDEETGITVMFMDEGLDTGDILLQRKITISPNETGGSLHDRLAEIAPAALFDALKMFPDPPRTPQDSLATTHAPKLKREHGQIDWNEPAEVIERKIRAFNPWPGAFTDLTIGKLKIFSAEVVDRRERPGQLYLVDDHVEITAGDRALALGEVQLEGKRRMSAAEFVRGHAMVLQRR
jgi:methionyl-tRNA formyltransferase